MSQKPDPRSGPTPETCRYTSTAAVRGASGTSSHSSISSAALTAKASGTNAPGETRCSPFEVAATRHIDTTAVAMTMAGSDVTSRLARYSASRVAFPAMNWAVTAAAHSMAVVTAARCGTEAVMMEENWD